MDEMNILQQLKSCNLTFICKALYALHTLWGLSCGCGLTNLVYGDPDDPGTADLVWVLITAGVCGIAEGPRRTAEDPTTLYNTKEYTEG